MKHALNFATKLNSRDIQKCNWFWVPSYDLNQSFESKIPGSAPGENAQDGTNDSAVWNFPPQDECDEQYSSTFFPEFVSVIYFDSFLDYCSHIH